MKPLLPFILSILAVGLLQAQVTVFKPIGCSASIGPGVSNTVLQHADSRYHLLTLKWADIEPTPGTFSLTALKNLINTVKASGKKYALAINAGGPGSPSWLISTYSVSYMPYTFQTTPYNLPLWWDNVSLTRMKMLADTLGARFNSDTSLALVYVPQMSANGNEGHLNGINMTTFYSYGFTQSNWINSAKQTAKNFALAFPNKAIAFEVHDIDGTHTVPATIINDLYADTTLCHRIGAATWWLSGKTTYQTNLLNYLQAFQGDKYAQMIAKSSQPERFKDSTIATAFAQAKQLGIRYIEPWLYEYQNNTINNLLQNFNAWGDSAFVYYNTACGNFTGVDESENILQGVTVSPNPSSGVVKIVSGKNMEVKAELYNALGELIEVKEFANETVFDISRFQSGIYFIRISNGDKTKNTKIVKVE